MAAYKSGKSEERAGRARPLQNWEKASTDLNIGHYRKKNPRGRRKAVPTKPRAPGAQAVLQVEDFVGADYQGEGECGYGDFTYEADCKGAEALLPHFAEVGAEADAGEG